MKITEELVKKLIAEQFPEFLSLPIKPIENMGHDNRTFYLGEDLTIRLPSGIEYVDQAKKEQQWLPYFKDKITLDIPTIVAKGVPSNTFPYTWGIYQWLEGDTVANSEAINQNMLAVDLANFLKEFHSIDCTNGPVAGKHNFYRGGDVSTYHQETLSSIEHLKEYFDQEILLKIWHQAIASTWALAPVWVHGDLVPTNMLVKNNRLSAIIDFGILGIGDPACDLAMYWTYFNQEARVLFKKQVHLDQATWDRARGWVLWKALISYDAIDNKETTKALAIYQLISLLCDEYC